MKLRCLYIIMSLASLLFLTNCRDEEVVRSSEGKRTITVDLGITLSRATDEEGVIGDNSRPDDLQLWIFDGNTADATRIFYENITEDLQFSMVDLNNRLVQTIERIINVENEINILHFYIVMNGTGILLGENSTPQDIEEATFTQATWTGDNKVPLYGYGTLDVSKHRSEYSVSIDAKRAVGKLELFFTKENANFTLGIKDVTLTKNPDKGYLVKPETYSLSYSEDSKPLFSSTNSSGTDISAVLTNDDATLGNFSKYQDDKTKLQSLFSAYLLENPNGGEWAGTEGDGKLDYTYPENITPVSDDRYKMKVTYQVSGSDKTQEIYLPEIKRNYWNKIFVRVKDDGKLSISYRVLFWEEVKSQIGWNPEEDFGYTYNAPMAAWRIHEKKIDADFRDAREGDEEATVCYVLNPRFGRSNNQSDHNTLVAKSSYAGFYFCMKEPDGAIWKAYLTNPDDFELSTGGAYDSDGDGTNDKHCVITGIAREEHYQIQVGAKKPWTIASEEEGNGFEGEDSGWDVLAPWGEQIENSDEQYDIHTDLYILVSLDQGITWNTLDINRPDFTPTDKTPEENPEGYRYYLEHTYWYNNRRFAGGDDYIRIWQLKAEKGGDFVEMVDKLDEKWAIKAYWKGDDSN